MDENSMNTIEITIKVVTALILALGFWFSIEKFRTEQVANREAEDKRRREEAKTKFWEKQLSLYIEVCNAAATLANEDETSEAYKNAEKTFWRFYYGSLCIVEDQAVASSMISFGSSLMNKERDKLKMLCIDLAHNCRKEVSTRWMVELPELSK